MATSASPSDAKDKWTQRTTIGIGAWGWIPTYGPGSNIVWRNGVLHATWIAEDDEINVLYTSSKNEGQNWAPAQTVARSSGTGPDRIDYDGNGSSLAVGYDPGSGADVVHVAWGGDSNCWSCYPTSGGIYYARQDSTPSGWSAPVNVAGSIAGDSYTRTIAADDAGRVFVAFGGWDTATGTRGTYFNTSRDGGRTWDPEPAFLALTGVEELALTTDAAGNLHAAWNYSATWPDAVTYYAYRPAGDATTFTAPVLVANATRSQYAGIAAGAGKVCVAWNVWGVEAPVACSYDFGVTWRFGTPIPASPEIRPSLAIDASGGLHVGFATRDRGEILAQSQDDGLTWSQSTVDVEGSWDAKIAVNPSGRAFYLYPSHGWDLVYFKAQKKP